MKSWMPAKVATRAQVSTSSKTAIDFDAEGRALWEKLNLDSSNKGGKELSPIDPIFKHPIGGGTIYVGGSRAAKNLKTLRDNNITSVVNCTYALVHKAGGKVRSKKSIPNYHEGTLSYYDFPISHFSDFVTDEEASLLAFMTPMFTFVERAILRGESVLIHCLAGAHRAGTTGVACLIHFADMEVSHAIAVAKRCRPIIDPIGDFPMLLAQLRSAELVAAASVSDASSKQVSAGSMVCASENANTG